MPNTKKMQIGNFNITFGENYEPMLTHFIDIIYPCFTSQEFKRHDYTTGADYVITDAEIKKIDNEFVFVGNYVKSTSYIISTTFENNHLKDSPGSVPTAPYSRFIIFLKNHRMVLVNNESASPKIKSFQKTVSYILNNYIKKINKEKSQKEKLPYAIVNIVDIPFSGKIKEALADVKKVNALILKFFPLNNDISPFSMYNDINNLIINNSGSSGSLIINSPQNKAQVIKTIDETGGLAVTQLKVTEYNGSKLTIKQDSFASVKDISIDKNVQSSDDNKIYQLAKQEQKISVCSEDNKKLYESLIEKIETLKKELEE